MFMSAAIGHNMPTVQPIIINYFKRIELQKSFFVVVSKPRYADADFNLTTFHIYLKPPIKCIPNFLHDIIDSLHSIPNGIVYICLILYTDSAIILMMSVIIY